MKDVMPLLVMNVVNYLIFDLDDEINKLLNTRFNKTQQMWLNSLESMPIGVMIYNTTEGKVIFENKKLDKLFEGHKFESKYQCTLKSQTENNENQEHKTLLEVLKGMVRDCHEQEKGPSLQAKKRDRMESESEEEQDILSFKIIHSKKKIGMHISLFENDEYAIVTFSDLTRVKRYEKERLSLRF